jgi:CelD/BcsL family acetyltransferase involved in cellulose biosynthesis
MPSRSEAFPVRARAVKLPRKCQFGLEGQPMTVTVVRTPTALAAHTPAWDALAAQTIEPNVFYESWMLLPALAAWGQLEEVCVVLIYTTGPSNEGSQPILCGLFPLVTRNRFKGLPVRYSSLWKYKYCALCTPLIHPTYAADCLKTFFGWLDQAPEAGSFLEMPYLGGDGWLNQLLTNSANESRNLMMIEDRNNRALLEIAETTPDASEAYITTALSGKRRKELRRQEKLLREQGSLEFAELRPGDDAESWFEEFLQLEAKGWKGEEGSALVSNAASKNFFLTMVRAAAQRGQLMMLALRLNGQTLAMKCNLLAGPGSFAFKIAFDEAFASFSPGVQLELENIRRMHELPARQRSVLPWPTGTPSLVPAPAVQWMDSCATAKHFMINRLWLSRRTIKTVLVATSKPGGNLIVALNPLLRWLKRNFFNHIAL